MKSGNSQSHSTERALSLLKINWLLSIIVPSPTRAMLVQFSNREKNDITRIFTPWLKKEKRITPFWISVHVNSKTFMAWKFSTRFGTCYFVVMERVSTGSEFRASCPQWANSSWLNSRKRAPTSITIIVSDLSVNKDFRWTRRINRAEYKLCLENVRCTFGSFESCFSFTFLPHATKLSPMSTR